MLGVMEPSTQGTTEDDDSVVHITCCDDDLTLCGWEDPDMKHTPEEVADCVVCLDLSKLPCRHPRCDYLETGL